MPIVGVDAGEEGILGLQGLQPLAVHLAAWFEAFEQPPEAAQVAADAIPGQLSGGAGSQDEAPIGGLGQQQFARGLLQQALLLALVLGSITSRRRVAHAMLTLRPPRLVVHETVADARERRARAATVMFLGVGILLLLDTLVSQIGATAALVAGAGIGMGIVDRLEARRWARAEDERDSRIFLMLRPNALIARMGVQDAYEMPRARWEAVVGPLPDMFVSPDSFNTARAMASAACPSP